MKTGRAVTLKTVTFMLHATWNDTPGFGEITTPVDIRALAWQHPEHVEGLPSETRMGEAGIPGVSLEPF